nr:uncharacterized protein LOC110438134 [Danio rerio]|eukprot:XP_021323874.1 uncharacterized protein LOC110438134 [Danio rerio]
MDNEMLTFMTWNTNGLKTKPKDVKAQIDKFKCDVAFIQETHISPNNRSVFDLFQDSESFFTTYKSKERGVAILIKKDLLGKSKTYDMMDDSGCYIAVKCNLKGQLYTLVSVYVHQVDARPLKKLRILLENFAEGILLIGGDFNIPLNPYLDRKSSTKNERHFMLKPTVDKFMTSFHLVDVWRRLHPIDCQYSTSHNSRLDYVFVPEESMRHVKSCTISMEKCCSDHQPVLFEIKKNCKRKRGPPNHFDDNTQKKKQKILKQMVGVNTKQKKREISTFVPEISKQWLSCKQEYWGKDFDLTYSQKSMEMIPVMVVEKAIHSLAVNENESKQQDCNSLSFYKRYSFALIPYLCVFYHKILHKPMATPKYFNKATKVGQHCIFNIDYLILTTIMARWLCDHLDLHSSDYRKDNKKTVVLAFKNGPKMIPWSFLESCLAKEQKRKPPLMAEFKIDFLKKILKNSKDNRYKMLFWGCPLTPVLMRLCLTHVAERFIERANQPNSEIQICKENVIVRLNENVREALLKKAEHELPTVYCKFVDALKEVE